MGCLGLSQAVCVCVITFNHMNFEELTSIENLFQAWNEFRKGKRKRIDVQNFERNLEDNLFKLYDELKTKSYRHGSYQSFYVHDPKQRHIHKAEVKDRIVHHLLYTYLYKLFDKSFIFYSYSCRLNKGTHKAVDGLEKFIRIVSKNYTKPCWVLKLDIKKFFASVDHQILKELLREKIYDKDILCLLEEVIDSFPSGIPLGNLTSQIFANIYIDKLDQFIKHTLKTKYYIRYADDFVFLSNCFNDLNQYIKQVEQFLQEKLKLHLHPKKIILRRLDWGIDFLGYTVLPHFTLPRTKTKKRIFNKLKERYGSENFNQSLASYLGYLSHAQSFKITQQIKNYFVL